ncbi:cytoskeletal protein RodZ [Psychromicrobium silvestre]|uniref:Cytoskeletal protein RodZ n=1 Tax=Psychromicrobium silvestre TaxID=1645614 RepID=A0A7Y9LVG6_9MICC|nr:LytR C-terminal domain-containing protein [Psychromicrobium silvestre]NYE96331.1 cytoskeletal protein RodZ [Psychromicrobium silvestre]
MSNYPRDEFDNVPESSSRQGAHRSVMAEPRRPLWPIVAFAAAALLIGAAAFLLIPRLTSGTPSANSSTTASTNTTSATPKATTSSPAKTTAAATSKPPVTPSAPPLDKTQPVNVYNGAGIVGLAARVAQQVRSDGWVVPINANWSGVPQPSSVIFYNGSAQKTNAEELGKLLGISRLVDTAELGIPLAVVLGPGAQ